MNEHKLNNIRPGDSAIGLPVNELIELYFSETKKKKYIKEKFWQQKSCHLIEILIWALERKRIETGEEITPYSIIDSLSPEGITKLYEGLEFFESIHAGPLSSYVNSLEGGVDNFNWMADKLKIITRHLFASIVERVDILGAIENTDKKNRESANGAIKKMENKI